MKKLCLLVVGLLLLAGYAYEALKPVKLKLSTGEMISCEKGVMRYTISSVICYHSNGEYTVLYWEPTIYTRK